jgi:two-component system nitrogen regulation response regulator NtrX
VPVRVPSLAERREDIPELIEYFAKLYSVTSGQPQRKLATDAIAMLQTQEWPGNVRQLRNNIERVMILASGDPGSEISASMLPPDVGAALSPATTGFGGEHLLALPLRDAREAFERDYVAAQLSRFGGNISRTAQFVGMERSALHRKIKLLGLTVRGEGEDLVAVAK